MVDSRKIDDYFDNDKIFADRFASKKNPPVLSGWMRFVKLGFPCFAALLLGVMVVMPNIRKSVDLQNNVTMPRKNEMEQLHMESTVFSATDSKNRVNRITADSVDETEAGSQKYKMDNPRGTILTDDGEIVITAPEGLYDQNANTLDLMQKVHALVNEKTTIDTKSGSYDFNAEYGHGQDAITASGDWGNLEGEAWTYSKQNNELTLLGRSKVVNVRGVLTAQEQSKYFYNDNKLEAVGNVVLQSDQKTIYADKLVAFLTDTQPREVKRAEAYGHVRIKTTAETANAAVAIYDVNQRTIELFGMKSGYKNAHGGLVTVHKDKNELRARQMTIYLEAGKEQKVKYIKALGNVEIITPKGKAKGDRGEYKPNDSQVELWDNVEISQDGNFVRGGHATTDLQTSVSRIMGREKGERISGTFYKKGNKNNGQTKK